MARMKTGGRQSGTPNRRTTTIQDKLAKLGCDPIEGMAQIAMDQTAELSLRAQMFKELAQYVEPKRKAIEISGPEGRAMTLEDLVLGAMKRERELEEQ